MKSTLVDLHHRYPWCTKQRQRIPAHLRSQEDQVRNNLYQNVAALSFILEAYTYELTTDTQCHARQKGKHTGGEQTARQGWGQALVTHTGSLISWEKSQACNVFLGFVNFYLKTNYQYCRLNYNYHDKKMNW